MKYVHDDNPNRGHFLERCAGKNYEGDSICIDNTVIAQPINPLELSTINGTKDKDMTFRMAHKTLSYIYLSYLFSIFMRKQRR